MRVFLINGPPRSGKDMTGRVLAAMLEEKSAVIKFASKLKLATHAALSVFRGALAVHGPAAYEATKDEPSSDFYGRRPRDCYIRMSEDFCKPLFGKGFFGKVLLEEVKKLQIEGYGAVVVTDCGFAEEVQEILEVYGQDVHLIRLERSGCSYDGDSRSDVEVEGLVPYVVSNDGSLAELRLKLAQYLTTVSPTE